MTNRNDINDLDKLLHQSDNLKYSKNENGDALGGRSSGEPEFVPGKSNNAFLLKEPKYPEEPSGYDEEDSLIGAKEIWYGTAMTTPGSRAMDLPDAPGSEPDEPIQEPIREQGQGAAAVASEDQKKRKKTPILLAVAAVVVLAVILLLLKSCGSEEQKPDPSEPSAGISTGQSQTEIPNWATNETEETYELRLNTDRLALFVDDTTALTVSGVPEDARLKWKSSDKSVAKVDDDGQITAVGVGRASITVTWKHSGTTYEASAEVSVEASGVTLNVYQIDEFYVGQSMTLTAATSPANQKVTWASSDEAVATVNENGVVTAVDGGSATITASFGDYSESCTVTVTKPEVTLTRSSVSLYTGDSASVSASVVPGDANVSWSSDDSGVAAVSGGTIRAVGGGSTTIRAKITFEGKTYEASCTVKVTKPSVSLSSGSLSLLPGGSSKLSADVTPSDCSVSWSSSNTGVATVSGGNVTAVAPGSATITAKISYGGKSYQAECSVAVAEPTISVTSSADTITYSPRDKDSATLTASVTPDGGSITWSSSDSAVATVSGNGTTATVTAVTTGSATITATYSVAGRTVTDSCTIAVEKAASQLRLDNFAYSPSGTIDSFWVSGTISSNYPLVRVENIGTATSNALNITVGGDTTEPFYFDGDVYSVDASILCSYFIEQYRTLYNAYALIADVFGADDSVTMNVTITCYDASGYSESRQLTFVVYQD